MNPKWQRNLRIGKANKWEMTYICFSQILVPRLQQGPGSLWKAAHLGTKTAGLPALALHRQDFFSLEVSIISQTNSNITDFRTGKEVKIGCFILLFGHIPH